MALIVEAGELVEHFQWLTERQSRDFPSATVDKATQELADILIYLIHRQKYGFIRINMVFVVSWSLNGICPKR